MKCIFEINARVSLKESAELKHQKIIASLMDVSLPWGLDKQSEVPFPGFKDNSVALVQLKKNFNNGIKMDLMYRYRNMLDDHHSSDDRAYVEFNSNKIDYKNLIEVILPKYIDIFNPYFVGIYNESLIYKDFEASRNKNYRKTVIRFYPVLYYDEKFCTEVLKMGVKDIFKRVRGDVFKVDFHNNGIIIIAGIAPFSVEESDEFDKKMRILLAYKG